MQTLGQIPYYLYWGKARPLASEISPGHHLLPYHSLDVAAVGKALLERHPRLKRTLAALVGIDEKLLTTLVIFFLALHDLGKFSERFQNLRSDLMRSLLGYAVDSGYPVRHDSMGLALWDQLLWRRLSEENDFWKVFYGNRTWVRIFGIWAESVTGHHGKPAQRHIDSSIRIEISEYFSARDQQAAVAFANSLTSVLLREPITFDHDAKGLRDCLKKASWVIAGLVSVCDWIASNENYFDFLDEPVPLENYWIQTQKRAEIALDSCGILPSDPSPNVGMAAIFPTISEPSPLQNLVSEIEFCEGPQLFIVEDVTGSGKTEAALALAHRLMAAGLAEGIFVGMPTMATANAMYERVGSAYKRIFRSGEQPTIVLAHSARHLSEAFEKSLMNLTLNAFSNYGPNDEPTEAYCAAWIADNRKKALLAQIGVGTIDQALLAVLPVKYQSLRLFGLYRKALIIDEAHSYDSYTNKLLAKLLTFHAMLGGSVILLSATLPKKMRQELVDAYLKGLGTMETAVAVEEYPLLTHVNQTGVREIHVDTRADMRPSIKIEFKHNVNQVHELIRSAVDAGKCACWIRNTVQDAIESFENLRQMLPVDRIMLFHARFAMGDRLNIEDMVLAKYGLRGRYEDRNGQVLIATQVVEQSLDLDFDFLITDLAPIDLLIQRAGRLHRHARDKFGNLLERGHKDQRDDPVFYILGPPLNENPSSNWYSDFFPKASTVYPFHGDLWLTAKILMDMHGWKLPDQARLLLEAVYGGNADDIPVGLGGKQNVAIGQSKAERSLADLNSLNPEDGYSRAAMGQWLDDTLTPTRLGELQTTLRLTRWKDGLLQPWINQGRHPWEMSQIQVRKFFASKELEPVNKEIETAILQAKESMPDKGRWSILVPLTEDQDGQWVGRVQDESGKEVALCYSTLTGLKFHQGGG